MSSELGAYAKRMVGIISDNTGIPVEELLKIPAPSYSSLMSGGEQDVKQLEKVRKL